MTTETKEPREESSQSKRLESYKRNTFFLGVVLTLCCLSFADRSLSSLASVLIALFALLPAAVSLVPWKNRLLVALNVGFGCTLALGVLYQLIGTLGAGGGWILIFVVTPYVMFPVLLVCVILTGVAGVGLLKNAQVNRLWVCLAFLVGLAWGGLLIYIPRINWHKKFPHAQAVDVQGLCGCAWKFRERTGRFPESRDELLRISNKTECLLGEGPAELEQHAEINYRKSGGGFAIQVEDKSIWLEKQPLFEITEEGRLATNGIKYSYDSAADITFLTRILNHYKKEHPEEGYPNNLQSATPLENFALVTAGRFETPNSLTTANYRVEYVPKKINARNEAFALNERPLRWGHPYVRSYYVDESGIVRGTPENRDANASDLEIESGEFERYIQQKNIR